MFSKEFNKKIFYSANSENDLNVLDSFSGINKISNNLFIEPNKTIGIAEYGINQNVSFDTLKHLMQEHPQALIASCIS